MSCNREHVPRLSGAANWCCSILSKMNEMRNRKERCDTSITVDGGFSFPAHSVILSASSPVLHSSFPEKCEGDYLLPLGDISPVTMTCILDFLYSGKMACSVEQLDDVRLLAEKLAIKKVVEAVTNIKNQVKLDLKRKEDESKQTKNKRASTGNAKTANSKTKPPKKRVYSNKSTQPSDFTITPVDVSVCDSETGSKDIAPDTLIPPGEADATEVGPNPDQSLEMDCDNISPERSGRSRKRTVKYSPDDSLALKTTPSKTVKSEQSGTPTDNTNEGVYLNCKFCPKRFLSRRQLFEHENRHQDIRAYKCSQCDKAYFQRSRLLIHENIHSGEKPYECGVCKKRFGNPSVMKTHSKVHLRDVDGWKCTVCQANCESKQGLLDHQNAEHGGVHMPIACEFCPKRFQLPEQLKLHMRYHRKKHVCSDCGKHFITKRRLDEHSDSHGGFSCDLCPMVSKCLSGLISHRKSHNDKKSHRCKYCGQFFSTSHELKEHRQTHVEVKEKPRRQAPKPRPKKSHACTQCDKTYTTNYDLKIHVRTHTGERPFVCSICSKGFISIKLLQRHKRAHTGEKYSCSHCAKSYTNKSYLNIHMRTHTGERPFPCTLCPLTFTNSARLTQHTLRHTGQRKFLCSFCNKGFWAKVDCEVHQRSHTGEKPFMCSGCGQRFISRKAARRHEKTHETHENSHAIQSLPCVTEQQPQQADNTFVWSQWP